MAASTRFRHRVLLQRLWANGPMSRWELHESTGIRPNTIGTDAGNLIRMGLLREGKSKRAKRGRPRVPLEIDPERRTVLGIAHCGNYVEAVLLNLLGEPQSEVQTVETGSLQKNANAIAELTKKNRDRKTQGIGLIVQGCYDREQRLLFPNLQTMKDPGDMHATLDAADRLPVTVGNDLHAIAARWTLKQTEDMKQDVLFIHLEAEQVSAVMLYAGRPPHTRLVDATSLARVMVASSTTSAPAAVASSNVSPEALTNRFAEGLSHTVDLLQPRRVMLSGPLVASSDAFKQLSSAIHYRVFPALEASLQIDSFKDEKASPASMAGWLGLAELYLGGWRLPESGRNARNPSRVPSEASHDIR